MLSNRDTDFGAVVVAAGSSTRFGGAVPKQFLPLAGQTVLARSVGAMTGHPAIGVVVVVLAPGEMDTPRALEVQRLPGSPRVVAGGARRSDSVRLGLEECGDVPFVLVHDAARPLVGSWLIDSVIDATRRHGAAVPGLAVHDTVKQVDADGWIERTLDRSRLQLIQTPQGARREWLLEALSAADRGGREVTDEASALELAGRQVALVPGEPGNRKLTTTADLEEARAMLEGEPEVRIGSGFDIHRCASDRPLVLGGVEFPGETGLDGHSDADVVLHAAMDAVLGAAALGDIGVLFPPEDPSFKGADSRELARQVAALVEEKGYSIVNLDLTLLAERPRIRPRHGEMREAIGACFGIPAERVGLKATTLERLGALGRREGMACQAVALVRCRREAG